MIPGNNLVIEAERINGLVPEPSALALIGIAGVLAMRRWPYATRMAQTVRPRMETRAP